VSNFKPNYFQRRNKPQGPRANERIRSLDVQVIGSDGGNLGTLPLKQAIELAKKESLDLIEISPNANPPVCKIMDMGKYKYDQQKKANQAKKKQKIVSLKEIKLRPGTEAHDYNFKIKNAKKFIIKGNKVKFTVKFKGREMQHTDLGKEMMDKIIKETKDVAKVESKPKFEGRQMVMIIQPL
jgi:translation initiation factor IF-3